jgi:DNA-binding MarR family transcriptional regulator/GNAT superfamily N-acetyltransferase
MILASVMPKMGAAPATAADVPAALRRFNRFYTARIGALGVGHLGTPFSLTEARVLFELGHQGPQTAAVLAQALEVDPAQVSRSVARLIRARVVTRTRDEHDGRAQRLSLTARGRTAFTTLDGRSRARAEPIHERLGADARARLVAAMRTIEDVLSESSTTPTIVIRPHRPGDLGWIVSRHGSLYAEEYGWDASFEALVAGVAKDFIERFDPAREACWMAEVDGRRVGSVCLVKKSATVAKLRLLIVDRSARGLGIGSRLVDECLAFARRAGYKKVTLWTNSILDAARHLYERAGFVRTHVGKVERVFGKDLVFETWDLSLEARRR